MLKYNRDQIIERVGLTLDLRKKINEFVDEFYNDGMEKVCFLGIGGTWASAMQLTVHMKERSEREIIQQNAAEYIATGNKRIGKDTLVVISSVTGTTEEMVAGVKKAKEAGAKIIGFIDKPGTVLAELADLTLTAPVYEQLKYLMVADRILYLDGDFNDYDKFYEQLENHLAIGLADVEIQAEEFAVKFAEAHFADDLHYFAGAGNIYGATYSYAMCFWEEMHWRRTKSIHSAEFFHGMLEIIEEDTPITVFVGEDSQRDMGLRVANFLARYNKNHTIIDMADYKMEGIDDEYRGSISFLIMRAVTNRIDAHMERLTGVDVNEMRFYRQVDY